MCWDVSFANPHSLHKGTWPSSILTRWYLSLKCPVRIPVANAIFFVLSLMMQLALDLQGVVPNNSLACLHPGADVQNFLSLFWIHCFILFFTYAWGTYISGRIPLVMPSDASLASLSTISLPWIFACPGTQTNDTLLFVAKILKTSLHSCTSLEPTLGFPRAANVARLSEQKLMHLPFYADHRPPLLLPGWHWPRPEIP